MEHIMECVPNFSEGRDLDKVEKIVGAFRGKNGVKLLDYTSDTNHNRSVVTVVGEPEALRDAVVESIGLAVGLIDMTRHEGQHPRMAVSTSFRSSPYALHDGGRRPDREGNRRARGRKIRSAVFPYESSASAPHRQNLAEIRRGQFEGMAEKMKDPRWKPDFGPGTIHPTGGATAIGARPPLIAYNINLDTPNLEIATKIAKAVRHSDGGLRCCKALGVMLEDRRLAQVSINMTDFTRTAVYRIFEPV
jgi:glutamate formiminotransferase